MGVVAASFISYIMNPIDYVYTYTYVYSYIFLTDNTVDKGRLV